MQVLSSSSSRLELLYDRETFPTGPPGKLLPDQVNVAPRVPEGEGTVDVGHALQPLQLHEDAQVLRSHHLVHGWRRRSQLPPGRVYLCEITEPRSRPMEESVVFGPKLRPLGGDSTITEGLVLSFGIAVVSCVTSGTV